MLSNNKGISLVVLLVAITLISVLGASLVSVMTSKQKGFLHQIDSYRALNLANAGVEYAIRFASDATDNSIFYTNQELIMTKYFFQGQGSFEIRYTFNKNIDEDVLEAKGSYRNSASRFVRLHHFRRYISPLTLVPDKNTMPKKNGTYVVIPVINNNESPSLTVNAINLAINVDGMYLRQIRLNPTIDSIIDSRIVFDFNESSFPTCSMTSTPPCQDALGLLLPRDSLVMFNFLNSSNSPPMDRDSIAYYYLLFSNTAPNGKYIFKPIIAELPAVESTIIFTLP